MWTCIEWLRGEGSAGDMGCTGCSPIDVFAVNVGVISDGHAVLDTACLRGCARSLTLDAFNEKST